MDTQVGIVGAGPAGLLLAHLLHLHGIDSVVLEARSREYVEARVRAGVLEQTTVDLLAEAGVAERLHREGLVHHGLELRFDGRGHRIDFAELTGGRAITVYGQQEVVKDLIAARVQAGGELRFEVDDVSLHDLESERPCIRFGHEGSEHELRCDVVAGCDGFHGISRPTVPDGALRVYEREYPFAWLGILAEVAPSSEELIYCHHERGFALHSMRSPKLTRLYLQCAPDDDIEAWPDERIWDELQTRFATADGDFELGQGPLVEKGITPMRSFVAEPLRHGRLFLAGDAAHIVPRRRRRPRAQRGARRVVRPRRRERPRRLLGHVPAPRVARAALLVVDDLDAAPLRRRRPLRGPAPALAAALRRLVAGGGDDARRELRRARACLTAAGSSAGSSPAGACEKR
jgi:p-hydroxybenzoate 3-monooxygenase